VYALLCHEKQDRSLANLGCCPLTLIPTPTEENLTAAGGAALLVQAIRSLDVPGNAERHVRIKQRQRGLCEAEYVESRGWGVVERQGRKMVGFNGLQPMAETSLRYFPDKGDGIALFCNAEGAQGLSELLDSLTELLMAAK